MAAAAALVFGLASEVSNELAKVTWPTRKDLAQSTLVTRERSLLGPWSRGQRNTMLAFGLKSQALEASALAPYVLGHRIWLGPHAA